VNKAPRLLSDVFNEREVFIEVSHLIQAVSNSDSVVQTASIHPDFGGNGRYRPDRVIVGCDKNLDSVYNDWPMEGLPEDVEVCQHWIVSDDLAKRLANHGEYLLLVADEFYVWCRTGCGYDRADDLRFLDEEDVASSDC